LETAVIHMPNHIGTGHALAWCYLVNSNIDVAEQKFNTSLDIDNRFGETYGGLAMIETIRGNRDEAELLVRKALKLDKQSWSAWYVKSVLASKTNQKVSDKILSKLLETVPEGGSEPLKDTLSKYFIKARNKNVNTNKSRHLH